MVPNPETLNSRYVASSSSLAAFPDVYVGIGQAADPLHNLNLVKKESVFLELRCSHPLYLL